MNDTIKIPVVMTQEVNVHSLNASRDAWVSQLLSLANILAGHTRTNPIDLSAIDLTSCISAAGAHRDYWNTRTGFRRLLFNIGQDTIGSGIVRVHLVEWKLMSKSKNKINNISADIFAGRTSQPSYINEKGVYPPKSGVDARVLSQSKAALLKYGLFQSSTKESLSSNIQRTQEFISPLTAIDLLSRLMIFPSYDAAQKSFQHVWDGSWIGWFKNQPAPRDNLGCEMHGMSQHQAALELITVAVFGVFYGGFGWWRFSKVLIQGAWPWLNGYNKAYAKAVFSVILGLFAVVETGRVDNRGAGALMLQLASTLVARPGSLSNSVRVRGNNRLKAPKAKVYGTYIPPKGDKAGATQDADAEDLESDPAQTLNSEATTAKDKAPQGWQCVNKEAASGEVVVTKEPHENFVICGTTCNHGENVPFSGRVHVAHSLAELEKAIVEAKGIVIAQTLGDHACRNEVLKYVSQRGILTILRAEEQCIYCAYRLAHATCALIVIG